MAKYLTLTEIMAAHDVGYLSLLERIWDGVFPGAKMREHVWYIPADEITAHSLLPKRKREKVERTIVYSGLVTVYKVDEQECVSSSDAALLLGISRSAFSLRLKRGMYQHVIYRNRRNVSKRVYRLDHLR